MPAPSSIVNKSSNDNTRIISLTNLYTFSIRINMRRAILCLFLPGLSAAGSRLLAAHGRFAGEKSHRWSRSRPEKKKQQLHTFKTWRMGTRRKLEFRKLQWTGNGIHACWDHLSVKSHRFVIFFVGNSSLRRADTQKRKKTRWILRSFSRCIQCQMNHLNCDLY